MPTLQTSPVQEIIDKALALPKDKRMFIANTLWKSADEFAEPEAEYEMDPEAEAEWIKTSKRRLDELKSGRVKGIDLDDFLNEMRGKTAK